MSAATGGACASDAACGGPGDACVGTAVCDPEQSDDASGCVFGEGVVCDDGVACTADVCDPTNRSCIHVPQDDRCDDGIACTEDECSPLAPRDGCARHFTPFVEPLDERQASLALQRASLALQKA